MKRFSNFKYIFMLQEAWTFDRNNEKSKTVLFSYTLMIPFLSFVLNKDINTMPRA